MGAHSDVIALCEHALSIGRDHGYPPGIAATLDTLGTSLLQTGDVEGAMTCWREALDIFDRLAHPSAIELRERLNMYEALNSSAG
jgi:hypothetical protein